MSRHASNQPEAWTTKIFTFASKTRPEGKSILREPWLSLSGQLKSTSRGSSCSTAVERTPLGKNSRGHGFDSHLVLGLFLLLSSVSLFRSLKEVQCNWFPYRNGWLSNCAVWGRVGLIITELEKNYFNSTAKLGNSCGSSGRASDNPTRYLEFKSRSFHQSFRQDTGSKFWAKIRPENCKFFAKLQNKNRLMAQFFA